MRIGEVIKTRRLALNLTLEDVGRQVGVGKSTVRKWETGMIENMRRDKIAKLAEVLQISPEILVGTEIVQKEKPTAHVISDELTDEKKALMQLIRNCPDDEAASLLQVMQLYLDNWKQGK